MSKKMKRVAGETLPPPPHPPYGGGVGGVSEDAKTRLKHQTLLQDYQELQKETDEMRNKLDAAKERKMRLLGEIRFLRRRRNYLLKMKSSNRPQEPPVNPFKQHNLSIKGQNSQKREAALFKLPPLPPPPGPKLRGRMYSGKEAAVRNVAPTLDSGKEVAKLTHRKRISSGKEAAVQNAEPGINLNQSQKLQVANDTTFARFDLNQDTSLGGKVTTLGRRAPIFDLNEISTEEEELQISNEQESKIGSIRGGSEEQPNDLKLSICRNAGESSSRMGKRKISWQDPVALRV